MIHVVVARLAHACVNLLARPIARQIVAVGELFQYRRSRPRTVEHRADDLIARIVAVTVSRRRVRAHLSRPGGKVANRVIAVIELRERASVIVLIPYLRQPFIVRHAQIAEYRLLAVGIEIGGDECRGAQVRVCKAAQNRSLPPLHVPKASYVSCSATPSMARLVMRLSAS